MTALSNIAQPASTSSLRRQIVRHPVAAYLIMAFSFAWGATLPLLFSRQGFGVIQVDLLVKPFISFASFVGLALPAFLVTAAVGGKAGVMELVSRCLRWRVGIQWYLIALFGLFGVAIVAALPFFGLVPLQLIAQKWPLFFIVFLPGVIVPFLTVNLPEEIGWTGLVQSKLQERYGPVRASLLTAPFFALMHLPAYFVVGWIADQRLSLSEVAVLISFTAVFALFFRLVIMWLYNGSGGSLLIIALFHSALNMLSGQQLTPEFIPFSDASLDNLLVIGILIIVAMIIIGITRGRLALSIKEH